MRRAYTAAGSDTDVDGDIELRAAHKDRKLFLDDECPVCCAPFGSEYAVFQCGHVVCGACAARMLGFWEHPSQGAEDAAFPCPMCRRAGTIKLHAVEDAEFTRAMRSAGTMAPRLRAAATEKAEKDETAEKAEGNENGAQSVQARYGTAVSADGLEGLFVEIQVQDQVQGPQGEAGSSRVSRRFVVVDISGSMTSAIALLDFGPLVASMVGTWLCVVTFGTDVATVFEGVVSAGDAAPTFVANGTTNLHSALDHVRRKIEADGAYTGDYDVLLVTDGEPDDPELAVGAMRALKGTGRASVYLVGTGPNYNFDNCRRLLEYRCEEFEHAEPEKVCGALLARGSSARVRVAGAPESRMYLNGTVTAPVDGEHVFFANRDAHAVFTGTVDVGTMLVDGKRVAARHDDSLGYRIRGALLSMTAIARVKKACFELEVPAVARMHTLRHTARELAEHEFPGRHGILEMIEEGQRAVETGAERLRSTATASTVTAIARACTC
jgi:uncharacterized protein YegL